MVAATHGLVYDDLRHLSRLRMTVTGGRVELLAASTPAPLSAVLVSRVVTTRRGRRPGCSGRAARRCCGGLWSSADGGWRAAWSREVTLRNPHPLPVSVHLELELAADFAHVFEVKSGSATTADTTGAEGITPGRWRLPRHTTSTTAPRS